MRKHIVIVSEESVYAGNYKCGIGEVVDCLADALREYYDVTVVTIGQRSGGCRGSLVTLGSECDFYKAAALYINEMQPDLVHNFAKPDLILQLDVACPNVLTFDRWEDVEGYLDLVPMYDHVVTLSTAYAEEVKVAHPEAAAWPLKGIINGIDGRIYNRGSGLWGDDTFARQAYYRQACREDSGKKLVVCMGRLLSVKGTDLLISEAEAIAAAGVDLVVWGIGDAEYEDQLTALHEAGVLTYYRRMCGYAEMMYALRGADFYLMPSRSEVCGLQAMKAARMGCVPILAPVGGMGENFTDSTAVLITEGIAEAVGRAVALSDAEYDTIKANCMAGEWTWETRVLPWVELYGLPTAPKEIAYRPQKAAEVKVCPFAKKEDTDG